MQMSAAVITAQATNKVKSVVPSGSMLPSQPLGENYSKNDPAKQSRYLSWYWRDYSITRQNRRSGSALVGKVHAPEVSPGIKDLDTQFVDSIIRVSDANHAKFLSFLRHSVQDLDTRAERGRKRSPKQGTKAADSDRLGRRVQSLPL